CTVTSILFSPAYAVEPVSESGDGDRNDRSRAIHDRSTQPTGVVDYHRVLEYHQCAGPSDDGSSDIREPRESIDQISDETTHPHQDRHAEDQTKEQEPNMTIAGAGHAQNIVRAHYKVGDQNCNDGLTHSSGDSDAFMAFFLFLKQLESNPNQK